MLRRRDLRRSLGFSTRCSFLDGRPIERGGFDGEVVGVELGLQQNDRRDPPRHVHHLAGFFGGDGPAEDFLFAVAEPFFDDLIPADVKFPDVGGNVAPEGGGVELDVASLLPE